MVEVDLPSLDEPVPLWSPAPEPLVKAKAQVILPFLIEVLRLLDKIEKSRPIATDHPARNIYFPFVDTYGRTEEEIFEKLRHTKEDLTALRETWRPFLQPVPGLENFDPRNTYTISSDLLTPTSSGISGSYFYHGPDGKPLYVVKPIDEDIGGINNPKGFAYLFDEYPVRRDVSVYGSVFREAAVSQIARLTKLDSIAPETVLAILSSEGFHDLTDQLRPADLERYLQEFPQGVEKEKLCSLQTFVPNAKSLFEVQQDFIQEGLTDEQIAERIDQTDYEEANLLIWITGDTDAHGGNILLYPKSETQWGIQKIDNGLAFPQENGSLRNALAYLPNGERPLSEQALEKIAALDVEKIAEILAEQGLDLSIPALKDRMAKLQTLVQENPHLSIQKINREISRTRKPGAPHAKPL